MRGKRLRKRTRLKRLISVQKRLANYSPLWLGFRDLFTPAHLRNEVRTRLTHDALHVLITQWLYLKDRS